MTQPIQPKSETVKGFRILLISDSGEGKSYSLASLLEAGLKVYGIYTEHSIAGTLKAIQDRQIPTSNFFYQIITPTSGSWSELKFAAQNIATKSMADLQTLVTPRTAFAQHYFKLLEAGNNFQDQHGDQHGDLTALSHDSVVFIDSWSGVNNIVKKLVVGSKPLLTQPDWGAAQNTTLDYLMAFTSGLKCHFVLTCHIQRQFDEVRGSIMMQPNVLGRAIAPEIPREFDEVVRCHRDGHEYYWSTGDKDIVLKNRLLPMGQKLQPSFVPVYQAWKAQQLKESP